MRRITDALGACRPGDAYEAAESLFRRGQHQAGTSVRGACRSALGTIRLSGSPSVCGTPAHCSLTTSKPADSSRGTRRRPPAAAWHPPEYETRLLLVVNRST